MPAPLGLPPNAHVFVDETKAREFILVATWVAPGAPGQGATHGAALVVLETDEPSRAADLAVARGALASVRHLRHFEEPILWASDAVAWCLQRRGLWPGKVEPLIRSDQHLDENKPGMRP